MNVTVAEAEQSLHRRNFRSVRNEGGMLDNGQRRR
jgi:hypothetical protein